MDSNFVNLMIYLCIAVYIVMGRWIALKSWNLWHLPAGSQKLAALFFPTIPRFNPDSPPSRDNQVPDIYWDLNHGMFVKNDSVFADHTAHPQTLIILFMSKNKYLYKKKVMYVLCTTLFWPVKILLNIVYIIACVFLYCIIWLFDASYKVLTAFFFAFFPADKQQVEE